MNSRLNACELEIDLFCRGMRVSPLVPLDWSSGWRTRAGLGSGLDIVIPTDSWLKPAIWMNVPLAERFARNSPYVLRGGPEDFTVCDERSNVHYPIRIPQRPPWYDRLTSRHIPMSKIGVIQGTYLGVYVNPVCEFWKHDLNCRFCTTGCNVGENEVAEKTVDDVVETCWTAKQESGITFVHLNGGFQGGHGLEFVEPFVRAIKEEVGLLVGVQLAPEREFWRYDRLIDLGADHLSFCLELLDAEWFARVCPGKARTLGQPLFFRAMEHCVARLPRGAVSGEIIAGIEPIANTIEGIERIVSAGAFPTVCIFRPTVGSAMEDWRSPEYEEMRTVMTAMYETCRRQRMRIGVAPNIEVSLVVTPDDAALLAPRTVDFYRYEMWRRAWKMAARPAFSARQHAHPRRVSVGPPPDCGGETRA